MVNVTFEFFQMFAWDSNTIVLFYMGFAVKKADADFALAILNKYLEDNAAYVKTEICCTHYDDEVNHNYMKVRWAE